MIINGIVVKIVHLKSIFILMIWQNGRPIRQSRVGQMCFYFWGAFTASASIFLLCAVWHVAAQSLGDLVLPEPSVVFKRVYELLLNLQNSEILLTLYRSLIALSLAIVIGMSTGIVAGTSKTLSILLRPLITVLLGMPPIVWVVLALFWFGIGDASIMFTVIISVTPLTFASAARGMMTVDEDYSEMLDAYQIGWWHKIKHLYVPHLLNYLLPAAIVATGTGMKIAIMAELLGGTNGIGVKIADARTMLDTQEVLAYVVMVLTIIMIIEYLILEPIRILLTPWEY